MVSIDTMKKINGKISRITQIMLMINFLQEMKTVHIRNLPATL